jgi:hypothetical protein
VVFDVIAMLGGYTMSVLDSYNESRRDMVYVSKLLNLSSSTSVRAKDAQAWINTWPEGVIGYGLRISNVVS